MLRVGLAGGNPRAHATGLNELPGRSHYFKGGAGGRQLDVPTYANVRYAGVYPGVDLVYYGDQRQLEYDFQLAPGADSQTIRMSLAGADHLKVDRDGELIISTAGGEVRQRKPDIYQEVNGRRVEVAGGYKLKGRSEVGFTVGSYNPSLPLIIDPVLVYSTYLGGKFSETLKGIAADAGGNVYVTGSTYSPDFPATPGALQTTTVGIGSNFALRDAFVTKLNAAGNAAIYSTFLGGNGGNEEGTGIAVDAAGNAYVVGVTSSATDFPVTPGSFQPVWGGGSGFDMTDGFVAKLNPSGSALVYSTYLGGSAEDDASDIALDGDGNAYVAGTTNSANFPLTPGAFRTTKESNNRYAFVTKLNASGSALTYSTFIGGGQQGYQNSFPAGPFLAIDQAGNAYLTGFTYSSSFPVTPGAAQPAKASFDETDGYVTKLNPAGSALVYSTYLGGRYGDYCRGVVADAAGNAYVVGSTSSFNFPVTPGAYQTQFNGGGPSTNGAAFVTKFSPTGALAYSTFFESPTWARESGDDIALGATGEVYIVGRTDADNLPTTPDAFQHTRNSTDAYLARLSADGSALLYSTYYGGAGGEFPTCLALDAAGNAYFAGLTSSIDLPLTPGTFQTTPGGNNFDGGAFIAKVGAALPVTYSISGRVTDGAKGISRALVTLSGSLQGTQWTNANGDYSFGNLPPGGDYTVTPQSPYYDFGTQGGRFTNLSANQTADFTGAIHRYRIGGQIKDAAGNALAGTSVTLRNGQNGVNVTTQTDAAGNYSFADVPASPDTYTLSPFKAHYAFSPSLRRYTNLSADQTADFVGFLIYTIGGRLTDSETGRPLVRIEVDLDVAISGSFFRERITTDDNGAYQFFGLDAGGDYTVTPVNVNFSFAPPKQSFTNLSADQAADFVGTSLFANITGRMTDEEGNGIYNVQVNLSGPATSSGRTDGAGNYTFFGLRKGGNYTVTPAQLGYSFTPASASINLTANTTQNFTGAKVPPRPFTPGNVITSASNLLGEYTPDGALVQAVIIPYPRLSPNQLVYAGDLVLDKNGEVQIFNGDRPRLTSYDFSQGVWRQKSFDGWTTRIIYNDESGIASYGDYVYVNDDSFCCAEPTRGIIRVNVNDYSAERFAGDTEFVHLSLGQDGLLYGLSFGQNQVYAYDPVTMQRVRNITLPSNVNAVTANRAGDLFAVTRLGHVLHFGGNGAVVKDVSPGFQLQDIDISSDGRIVASGQGFVLFIDEGLNVIKSFAPPTGAGFVAFTKPASVGTVQLGSSSYSVNEGDGRVNVAVTRTGDASSGATVSYATVDNPAAIRCDDTASAPGVAFARCDYVTTVGTISFAPGVTQATISVPLIDDAHPEGNETLTLRLTNASGAVVGPLGTATITIMDNDPVGVPASANPILGSGFFVRQQYLDFFGREPDAGGFAAWKATLDNCPDPFNTSPASPSANCDRVSVSKNFFRSTEFELKGGYVFDFYKAALGRLPRYSEIIPDMAGLTAVDTAGFFAKKAAFTNDFVQRQEFKNLYNALTNQQFVDALMGRYNLQQVTSPNPASPDDTANKIALTRADLVGRLNGAAITRPQVLRAIADSDQVRAAEANSSFVAMQYFGYLRRDPEDGGYNDWLRTINANPADIRSMVNGFMNSQEYRLRFGPQ